jgi:hypothetical protein
MTKNRRAFLTGEAARFPVAAVQLPLPVLDVLTDTRAGFFSLCIEAGQHVPSAMMEHDLGAALRPKNVPTPTGAPIMVAAARARSHSAAAAPRTSRLRAHSVVGGKLALPAFAYTSGRPPLDVRSLEAIAIGVITRATAVP